MSLYNDIDLNELVEREMVRRLADEIGLDAVIKHAVLMKAERVGSVNPRALGINPRALGLSAKQLKFIARGAR